MYLDYGPFKPISNDQETELLNQQIVLV